MRCKSLLVLFLSGMMLNSGGWALGAGGSDLIDEREQFRIELPATMPMDTIRRQIDTERNKNSSFVEEVGAGIGFVAVYPDTVPTEIYCDGCRMLVEKPGTVFSVQQGRHYLSFFGIKDVYLAYRDETPEQFWRLISPAGLPADRYALLSSYEREAVRTGTRWITVGADDTAVVEISLKQTLRAYRHHATNTAITFFSVTAVIAAAMAGSIMLIARE